MIWMMIRTRLFESMMPLTAGWFAQNRACFAALMVSVSFAVADCTCPLRSKPCSPNDPEGENPGNICLVYPPYAMTLDGNTFKNGAATEGYFGRPAGPTLPGQPLIKGHHPRLPLDPRPGGSSGYWTGIEASNGVTQMRTNTGRQWTLKVPNP